MVGLPFKAVHIIIAALLLFVVFTYTNFDSTLNNEPRDKKVAHNSIAKEQSLSNPQPTNVNYLADLKSEIRNEIKSNNEELYNNIKELIRSSSPSGVISEGSKHVLSEELKDIKDQLNSNKDQIISESINNKDEIKEDVKKQSKREYYDQVIEIFQRNKPKTEKLTHPGDGFAPSILLQDIPEKFTIERAKSDLYVQLTEEEFEDLQSSHDNLVNDLRNLHYPSHLFKGNGIVMNGGGTYIGTALVAIRQLRDIGSKLPIELIMDTEEEYDEHVCTNVLPLLNTKCVVISRVIGEESHKALNLKKFELKAMGLFVSSFENVLLLDADNLAIKNPDYILETDPFTSSKYVMWPDLWHKGTSPYYFDIARIRLGEPVRRNNYEPNEPWKSRDETALHDLEGATPDISQESGQMAISKKDHYKSYLLSIYYNLNGYSLYYRLICQGVNGEGDKETFVPALHVFNEPYYQIEYPTWLAGYRDPSRDNFFQESTIVQYDPVQSMNYVNAIKDWLISKRMDSRTYIFQTNAQDYLKKFEEENNNMVPKPEVQFLHFHNPKINPILNFNDQIYDKKQRFLDHRSVYSKDWSEDWELKFFRISQWIACDLDLGEKFWSGKDKFTICTSVTKHVEFLLSDSDTPEIANLASINAAV